MFIPTDEYDAWQQVRRKKKEEAAVPDPVWRAAQRGLPWNGVDDEPRIAPTVPLGMSSTPRSEVNPWQMASPPGLAADLAGMNEWARQGIPAYSEIADLSGRSLDTVMRDYWDPTAGLISEALPPSYRRNRFGEIDLSEGGGAIAEALPPSYKPTQGYNAPLQGPAEGESGVDWWRGLGERESARREQGLPSIGEGVLNAATALSGADLLRAVRGVGPALRAIPGEARAAARMLDEAARSNLVRRAAPGLGIEDVGKGAEVPQKAADRAAEAKEGAAVSEIGAQPASPPKHGRRLVEEGEAHMPAAPLPRFEAGRKLTSEERKQILSSIVDVYKAKDAPKIVKGINRQGEEIIGYEYNPDYFERSGITGKLVRYYIKMPDGTLAHPSELFPEMTDAKITALAQEELAVAKRMTEDKARLQASRDARIVELGEGDQKALANERYRKTGRNRAYSYFAQDENGAVVRVDGMSKRDIEYYTSKGFIATTPPARPTSTTDDMGRVKQIIAANIDDVPAEVLADYPDLAINAGQAELPVEVAIPMPAAPLPAEVLQEVVPDSTVFFNRLSERRADVQNQLQDVQQRIYESRPPRIPLWEGKTGAEPPRRGGPPAPPTEPPEGGLPSGRVPGGEGNIRLTPSADPYEQLVSALTPERQSARTQLQAGTDTVLRSMYDRNWDAHKLEDATGVPVHKLSQLVPGSIAHGEFLVERHIDPIIASVGGDVSYLEQYLVARRFKDILARNPEARLPGKVEGWAGTFKAQEQLRNEVLRQNNGAARWAAIERAAAGYTSEAGEHMPGLWELNDELVLKPRLEAGLLSVDQYRNIKATHPHYVSFYREDFSGLQTGLGKGEANVTNAGLQQMDLEGSWRKLDNPLARIRAQVVNTQHLVAENKAAKAIVDALVRMESAQQASAGMARVPLGTGERFAKLVKPGTKVERSNIWDTISYLEDGQQVTHQVPVQFARMAKGLEAETANFWSRLARVASLPLRAGAVTYNVAFFPKNILRDLNSAFYREGMQPLSEEYVRGWQAALTHNDDYADAARAGVLMSGIVENMRTTNALARGQLGAITVSSLRDALTLIPRLIGHTATGIERAGMVSEQATRIGTYLKLRAQGLSELEAAVRARDATVDFAKSGNIMRVINQAIPFSNAGLQGAANTLRTMRYNPRQAIIGASPLAALSLMAYANNQKFETAKDIPEREYAMNWVFIVGEGAKTADPKFPNKPPERFPVYIRIPKGPIGGLLTAPVEMALRFAWMNDDRGALDYLGSGLGTMATSLSPVEPGISGVLPPLAGTAVGLFASGPGGYDTFRGQPIVPRGEQERPPESQYGPLTSNTAVALGERFKVSPRMIEWAIKDSAAGVGSQTLWLSDMILGASGYNPAAPGEAKYVAPSDTEQLARLSGGFLGTQSSQERNRGWDDFDKAVVESKRQILQHPTLRQLGLNIDAVPKSIAVEGYSLALEPAERAKLQRLEALVITDDMKKAQPFIDSPDWRKAPMATQIEILRAYMAQSRAKARYAFVGNIPESILNKRLVESLPEPVGP